LKWVYIKLHCNRKQERSENDDRHETVENGRDDGDLVFSVTDDGRGFDPATTPAGSGLQNMSDRVEALGGSLTIESTPGDGTTVSGRIPVVR
jgi:signal transduction histidine kinase